MNFVAIDFETATYQRYSACAIGLVTVEDSIITDKYYTLMQPPGNIYTWQTIQIHGIQPHETANQANFLAFFPQIIKRLEGQTIVAHNASFDRGVLKSTMAYYGLNYEDYDLGQHWECTCKIYRAKGYKPAKLSACCARKGIELNHHHALSDAEGCAQLYLQQ